MKKVTFIVLIATLAMFVLMSGVALAVGETPHGPFADDTTLCAACHRAHTAQSEYLLSESSTFNMCKACHSGGQGADADVDNGRYVVNGSWLVVVPSDRTGGPGAFCPGAPRCPS